MKKFFWIGENLYNQYRFEFCDLMSKNESLFSELMVESLVLFNQYGSGELDNYIGSQNYEKVKSNLYEMVLSSYIRIRLESDSRLSSLKEQKRSIVDLIRLQLGEMVDKLEGSFHSKFRTNRDEAIIDLSSRYFGVDNNIKDVSTKFYEESKQAENDKLKFMKLSDREKKDYFKQEKKNALLSIEKSYIFNKEKNAEALEN